MTGASCQKPKAALFSSVTQGQTISEPGDSISVSLVDQTIYSCEINLLLGITKIILPSRLEKNK